MGRAAAAGPAAVAPEPRSRSPAPAPPGGGSGGAAGTRRRCGPALRAGRAGGRARAAGQGLGEGRDGLGQRLLLARRGAPANHPPDARAGAAEGHLAQRHAVSGQPLRQRALHLGRAAAPVAEQRAEALHHRPHRRHALEASLAPGAAALHRVGGAPCAGRGRRPAARRRAWRGRLDLEPAAPRPLHLHQGGQDELGARRGEPQRGGELRRRLALQRELAGHLHPRQARLDPPLGGPGEERRGRREVGEGGGRDRQGGQGEGGRQGQVPGATGAPAMALLAAGDFTKCEFARRDFTGRDFTNRDVATSRTERAGGGWRRHHPVTWRSHASKGSRRSGRFRAKATLALR